MNIIKQLAIASVLLIFLQATTCEEEYDYSWIQYYLENKSSEEIYAGEFDGFVDIGNRDDLAYIKFYPVAIGDSLALYHRIKKGIVISDNATISVVIFRHDTMNKYMEHGNDYGDIVADKKITITYKELAERNFVIEYTGI